MNQTPYLDLHYYPGSVVEPIRLAYAKKLIDLFALFNQKQDERGPENVIKAGLDGILTQAQERIERVRAAMIRGKSTPEELRLNALDIAGFGIIAATILDGEWASADGRKPSTAVAPVMGMGIIPGGVPDFVDPKARAVIDKIVESLGAPAINWEKVTA